MKQESKHQAREQERIGAKSSQQFTATEFATAEELLRHDAAKTDVPPVIAERLSRSLQNLPGPARSWWRRIFKR